MYLKNELTIDQCTKWSYRGGLRLMHKTKQIITEAHAIWGGRNPKRKYRQVKSPPGITVSPTWHNEKFGSCVGVLHQSRRYAVSGTRYRVQSTYAVPSQPFQVPSHSCRIIGYGDTWKEEDVVKVKCSHPNYALLCGSLNSFTSLDNTSLIWAKRISDVDDIVPYAVSDCQISDGWRNMQIRICTSKQMFASLSATIATGNFEY
jgi:hypothetical protein